ncbi:MAG: tRNA adenosine(34) deaminase TadA [Aquiluna sp.]|nr:tRNA adenosine(34) deaminase TadA [Aquiluna sp.]
MDFESLMHSAIEIAAKSGADVPVGALLVNLAGEVVASAHNQKEVDADASAHAEILAIRRAGEKLGDWRLEELTLVVTLEPCVMCAGAIVAARIPRVVFGAFDEKVGAAGSLYDLLRDPRLGSPVEVVAGVLEERCQTQLKDYFSTRRALD